MAARRLRAFCLVGGAGRLRLEHCEDAGWREPQRRCQATLTPMRDAHCHLYLTCLPVPAAVPKASMAALLALLSALALSASPALAVRAPAVFLTPQHVPDVVISSSFAFVLYVAIVCCLILCNTPLHCCFLLWWKPLCWSLSTQLHFMVPAYLSAEVPTAFKCFNCACRGVRCKLRRRAACSRETTTGSTATTAWSP